MSIVNEEERWKKAQKAEKKHASHSDLGWNLDKYLRKWFDKDISFYEGKDILEVGAGTGMIHTLEFEEGTQVGIDPITSEVSDVLEDSEADLVITGAGESIPFKEETFDIVANHNVLDHCKNPRKVLREIYRVLTPGGSLVFHVNTFQLPQVVRRNLTYIDKPHPYHFDNEEVIRMMRETGFLIDKLNYKKVDMSSNSLKGFFASALLPLGRIYVIAQKPS